MPAKPSDAGDKALWVIATGVVVIVLVGMGFLFLRKGAGPAVVIAPMERPKLQPAVGLTNVLNEEATLLDPTPLYMPTLWNAGQNALPAELTAEPGQFQGYGAKLMFGETELKLAAREPVEIPAKPESLAAGIVKQPFLGMGQLDSKLPMIQKRSGFVEVVTAQEGVLVYTHVLTDASPQGWGEGRPSVFLVAVDKAGLVGSPVLMESSRVADVDKYFEDYLENALRIGERVGPGFYRISFGP